jgi:D-alanyl-D-alanine carboxypeptidase/D-alanyl-D-alanine-endopeptidase (penicillin-binding protein 4)
MPLSRRILLSALLLVLAMPAPAQAPEGLVPKLEAMLAEPGLKGGIQAVFIKSLTNQKVWMERNAELLLLPASNQKLLTSAAALHLLGPQYKYTTTLHRSGRLEDDGTLRGALTLVGAGDPTLMPDDLAGLVDSVKAYGIKKIVGRIIVDDTRFDKVRYGEGWSWDDMPFYYSAPISALCINRNTVTLTVDPGRKAGDPVRLMVSPGEKAVRILNNAKTNDPKSLTSLKVWRDAGSSDIQLSGVLAIDAKPEDRKPISVTVENPARFVGTVFLEKLRAGGIEVDAVVEEGRLPQSETLQIGRHESAPLSEIVALLNKPSDNLIAECLLKTLGAEKGKEGSAAEGIRVAVEWFRTIGIDETQISMADGSGLSRQNFVCAKALAVLLETMWRHPTKQVWLDSLPVAGVDGTLKSRMKGTAAEKNCRAKTGYVSNVSSLSGYVSTRDGEQLLFVLLMNNHKSRSAVPVGVQNRIVETLAAWPPQAGAR